MEFTHLPPEFGSPPPEFSCAAEARSEPREEDRARADRRARGVRKQLIRRMTALAASVTVVSMAVGLGPLGLPFPESGQPQESPGVTQPAPDETGTQTPDEPDETETVPEETTQPGETQPEALQAIPEDLTVITVVTLTKYETEKLLFNSGDYAAYGAEGQTLAKQWAESQGADWSKLTFIHSDTQLQSVRLPGTVIVGDPDDLQNATVVQGGLEQRSARTDYYDLEIPLPDKSGDEEPDLTDYGDDAFPPLMNPDPQTYDIQGFGSEHYVRFMDGEYDNWKYLVAGTYWTQSEGHPISTVPGASYDAASNTLTLENFTGPALDVNLMGNGFKIRLIGENRLAGLQVWGFMYGGSVTITGSGSLILNGDGTADTGLVLNAENSQSCLMVDREATLEVYGADAAIGIYDTTMSKSVYFLKPVRLNGGRGYMTNGQMDESLYVGTVFEENTGTPAKHVRFAPAR